jgi:hypothetical protein
MYVNSVSRLKHHGESSRHSDSVAAIREDCGKNDQEEIMANLKYQGLSKILGRRISV